MVGGGRNEGSCVANEQRNEQTRKCQTTLHTRQQRPPQKCYLLFCHLFSSAHSGNHSANTNNTHTGVKLWVKLYNNLTRISHCAMSTTPLSKGKSGECQRHQSKQQQHQQQHKKGMEKSSNSRQKAASRRRRQQQKQHQRQQQEEQAKWSHCQAK